MKRMDELDLPLVEDLFFMCMAEGGSVLACPLNVPLFGMSERDLIEGARLADPARYYKDVVMVADMNLAFWKGMQQISSRFRSRARNPCTSMH